MAWLPEAFLPPGRVELSTGHMRKQFDAMTEQSKELAALAQKVAADTAEPIKQGVSSAFKKVA